MALLVVYTDDMPVTFVSTCLKSGGVLHPCSWAGLKVTYMHVYTDASKYSW